MTYPENTTNDTLRRDAEAARAAMAKTVAAHPDCTAAELRRLVEIAAAIEAQLVALSER